MRSKASVLVSLCFGKAYLDFTSGIAVTALGHSHPKWIAAVKDQIEQLVHCSNLFRIPSQQALADQLIALTGPGQVLFCNSGAGASKRDQTRSPTRAEKVQKAALPATKSSLPRMSRAHLACMAATPKIKFKKAFIPCSKASSMPISITSTVLLRQ